MPAGPFSSLSRKLGLSARGLHLKGGQAAKGARGVTEGQNMLSWLASAKGSFQIFAALAPSNFF